MGEYAEIGGEYLKLGTCEAMYYVRWQDVKDTVDGKWSIGTKGGYDRRSLRRLCKERELHWRFPWPHEDHQNRPSTWTNRDPFAPHVIVRADKLRSAAIHESFSHWFKPGDQPPLSNMGVRVVLPCPHLADRNPRKWEVDGKKLFYGGAFNEKTPVLLRVSARGINPDGTFHTIVSCVFCDKLQALYSEEQELVEEVVWAKHGDDILHHDTRWSEEVLRRIRCEDTRQEPEEARGSDQKTAE